MNSLRTIYHLMRADFFERVRRYSFLITLGLTVYLGYTFVPPANAKYVTVAMGDYRGVYNSAWIGSMVAIMTSVFLALPGFYLVKNAVERDEQTGVGQIIAATPVSKSFYLLGKTCSNFAVLAMMVGILVLVALAMQFVRAEELRIDLWALVSPFVFITLPAMAVVAVLAVLFETIGWLRGGLGNVVYFFLWIALITVAIAPTEISNQDSVVPVNDVLGMTTVLADMSQAAKAAFPDFKGGVNVGYTFRDEAVSLQTFRWEGMQWTPAIVLGRLMWLGVAMGITAFAALFFHRFDPSREKQKRIHRIEQSAIASEEIVVAAVPRHVHLTPLPSAPKSFHFAEMLFAELRLMLKGVSRWWYLVACGLIVAQLSAPLEIARQWILPMAWIWPLLLWSAMGTREARHRTEELIFSAAHALRRQLPAIWLAGVIIAMLAGSGVTIRFLIAGEWQGVLAWFAGVLFIPTLALACGVWSGSSKLFEVIYTLLWYIGPLNRVLALDFMGATNEAVATGAPLIYFLCTITLFVLAVVGRKRQLQK
ncbi:MAG: hypothetical protein ACREOI_24205 [bacterium]